MGYRVLADLTMLVHFTFLAFVVFGGFLAWKWPRVIRAHVMVVAWGAATIALSLRCPLTDVEDWARARAGAAELSGTGFIDHYIEGVLYPQEYSHLLQAAAALVVLGSWLGLRIRLRSEEARLDRRDESPGALSSAGTGCPRFVRTMLDGARD